MNIKEAVAIIKSEVNMRVVDRNVGEAIDTVVSFCENPVTKLEKFNACSNCLAVGIVDVNCSCVDGGKYKTVQLEFEVCTCCGNIINDGSPADTPFNKIQLYGKEATE